MSGHDTQLCLCCVDFIAMVFVGGVWSANGATNWTDDTLANEVSCEQSQPGRTRPPSQASAGRRHSQVLATTKPEAEHGLQLVRPLSSRRLVCAEGAACVGSSIKTMIPGSWLLGCRVCVADAREQVLWLGGHRDASDVVQCHSRHGIVVST